MWSRDHALAWLAYFDRSIAPTQACGFGKAELLFVAPKVRDPPFYRVPP
jgi:hypothetical protein